VPLFIVSTEFVASVNSSIVFEAETLLPSNVTPSNVKYPAVPEAPTEKHIVLPVYAESRCNVPLPVNVTYPVIVIFALTKTVPFTVTTTGESALAPP
jgi:hypothetical protein